jgi:hypothetical protein
MSDLHVCLVGRELVAVLTHGSSASNSDPLHLYPDHLHLYPLHLPFVDPAVRLMAGSILKNDFIPQQWSGLHSEVIKP